METRGSECVRVMQPNTRLVQAAIHLIEALYWNLEDSTDPAVDLRKVRAHIDRLLGLQKAWETILQTRAGG